jgi:hypothetical protein
VRSRNRRLLGACAALIFGALGCRARTPSQSASSSVPPAAPTAKPPSDVTARPAPITVVGLEPGGCAVIAGGDSLCPSADTTPERGCALERTHPGAGEARGECALDVAARRVSCRHGDAGSEPVPLTGVLELHEGAGFQCARDEHGVVACWGQNHEGGLGDGKSHESVRPVRVRLPLAATQFSLGNQHGCALLADRSVWCWGENARGALGLGVLPPCCDVSDPKRPAEYLSPQKVSLAAPASTIHALGNASCALGVEGEVWCWGENDVGQLGAPATPEPLSAPRRVRGLPRIVELVMDEPSCARAQNGDVYCWGDGCPLLARSAEPVVIDWRSLARAP